MGFPQTLKTLNLEIVSIKPALSFFLLRRTETYARKINGHIVKVDRRMAKTGAPLNRMNHRIDEIHRHLIKSGKLLERG